MFYYWQRTLPRKCIALLWEICQDLMVGRPVCGIDSLHGEDRAEAKRTSGTWSPLSHVYALLCLHHRMLFDPKRLLLLHLVMRKCSFVQSQVKCGQHRPSGPGGATEFRSCLLLHSGIRKKWASSFYSAKSVCANNCQLVAKDKHGIQSKRKAMSNRSKTRVHCVTQESSQSYTMKCRLLKTSTPPQYSLMHQGGSVKNCFFYF